jgi:hypothetical protein
VCFYIITFLLILPVLESTTCVEYESTEIEFSIPEGEDVDDFEEETSSELGLPCDCADVGSEPCTEAEWEIDSFTITNEGDVGMLTCGLIGGDPCETNTATGGCEFQIRDSEYSFVECESISFEDGGITVTEKIGNCLYYYHNGYFYSSKCPQLRVCTYYIDGCCSILDKTFNWKNVINTTQQYFLTNNIQCPFTCIQHCEFNGDCVSTTINGISYVLPNSEILLPNQELLCSYSDGFPPCILGGKVIINSSVISIMNNQVDVSTLYYNEGCSSPYSLVNCSYNLFEDGSFINVSNCQKRQTFNVGVVPPSGIIGNCYYASTPSGYYYQSDCPSLTYCPGSNGPCCTYNEFFDFSTAISSSFGVFTTSNSCPVIACLKFCDISYTTRIHPIVITLLLFKLFLILSL